MTEEHARSHAGLLCPVCRVSLVMADRQTVEIDYCPQCRGVWLDRGEIDKIVERSFDQRPARGAGGERPEGAHGRHEARRDPYEDRRPYDEDRRRDDEEKRPYDEDRRRDEHGGHKRKSWLSDLFE